ncbi:MAG: DUF692 domain-containing protein [Alphaproteobacteria bacterium]|jgi:uncharacterized protein (UPF0276 family)|nr:DUF692 domain-containing protein [Alphaproteobacteria bacterium]
MTADRRPRGGLGAGAGLKPEHYRDILDGRPGVGWFEVHAENYMGTGNGAGGPPHFFLEQIRARYPLSVHGVGLSIGSAEGLAPGHLQRLAAVVDRYQPALVSEHLAWSTHAGVFLNDLLPLPYTEATLAVVVRHVDQVQSTLKRRILIENPSTYLRFAVEQMAETAFLCELARRSGCGLLLDVNNVFVSTANHDFDPTVYLADFPVEHIGEIHLAGHASIEVAGGESLLIDTHDRPVSDRVWALYQSLISRIGPYPTLIEWDSDVPTWARLSADVARAESLLSFEEGRHARAA